MADIEAVEVLVPGLQGPAGPVGPAGPAGGDIGNASELPTTDDGAFAGASTQDVLELIYGGKQPIDSRLTAIVATGIDTTMFAAGLFDTDITLAAGSATRIPSQSAVKSYIDNLLTGLKWKPSVLVKTTGNITLSGEQTIDGVLTSGSRVLVGSQSTASQNGIYVSAAGSWSRAPDADSGTELVQATCFVEQGATYGDTQWTCTNNAITLGSTGITFAQVSGAGTYSAGSGLGLTGNQFAIADDELLAIAGLTSAANKLPYFTGSGAAALADFTAAARNLLDDADAATMRGTLGLGTSAVIDTGTSGAKVPLLNGANTWSGVQTLSANLLFSADNSFDVGASAATRPRQIFAAGNINGGNDIIAAGQLTCGAAQRFAFSGRSQIESPADGDIALYNAGKTGFTNLKFGGLTSSFPALKRSSASLICRLADDSGDAAFQSGNLKATGAQIDFPALPTSDPHVAGRLWANSGVLAVSAG